jgi:hypothetical protein
MEVHPPHEPIHSWPQFFLHLFTISVGLLIALGIESAAEAVHHRHLLHQAETDLRNEMTENRKQLAYDLQQLHGSEGVINQNIKLLMAIRAHQTTAVNSDFAVRWAWNGMGNAAWLTARDTGALALMPYDTAQTYSMVYSQQNSVDEEAGIYIRDIYRSKAPVQGGRKLTELRPEELDQMIASSQQTLVDIAYLRDLTLSLDRIYRNTEGKL